MFCSQCLHGVFIYNRTLALPVMSYTGQVIAAVIRTEHLPNTHSRYDINEYIRLLFK